MAERSRIGWCDATWHPLLGCSRVSSGCTKCYAIQSIRRLAAFGIPEAQGLVSRHANGQWDWTGEVRLLPERLDEPLGWKKPRRIFVGGMSDLFHENVPDAFLDEVIWRMNLCRLHTFQCLTKRPERMERYFGGFNGPGSSARVLTKWPLPNVQVGTSAENQATLDDRWPHIAATPAAVRFLSLEPLLGPIDMEDVLGLEWELPPGGFLPVAPPGVQWVIVGGESGPGFRPMKIEWLARIVEQCRAAGVPCFVKQDAGRWPERQGDILDDLWKIKQTPDLHARYDAPGGLLPGEGD